MELDSRSSIEELITAWERRIVIERRVAIREAGLKAAAEASQRGEDPLEVLALFSRLADEISFPGIAEEAVELDQ